ncbi:uncharacterized protein [Drosophila virilis]|uniref:Secreted protein n=1 Tax=Drosophila virilis TaxID=7244 RepID=B4LI22_DROVI|nr:uncharacterized protein LOC6623524 [Drosophila virilis]EDW68566.1 uncharacterized protein Dvir_GJ12781 [Drosophila virilis]
MRIRSGDQQLLLLLLTLALEPSWTATILHSLAGPGSASAISHQSFVRLTTKPPSAPPSQLILQVSPSTMRIVNGKERRLEVQQLQTSGSHTPAHLTYAARPVVHQMLPRIKPVRNISYASLLRASRALSQAHTHTQLKFV